MNNNEMDLEYTFFYLLFLNISTIDILQPYENLKHEPAVHCIRL